MSRMGSTNRVNCFRRAIHKVGASPAMHMQVNKTGRNITALGIDDDRVTRQCPTAPLDARDRTLSADQHGVFYQSIVRDDRTIVVDAICRGITLLLKPYYQGPRNIPCQRTFGSKGVQSPGAGQVAAGPAWPEVLVVFVPFCYTREFDRVCLFGLTSQELFMATFIVNIKFSQQGIKDIDHSTKRAATFKAEAKKLGAKVKETYWTLGEYDGLLILEAPDDETAAAAVLHLGAMGNVHTTTYRAFTTAEMEKLVSKLHPVN